MPFPRFMLMRDSLRGNRNHSVDNPLEQDQAAASLLASHHPCLRGCMDTPSPLTHEPMLPAATCVSVILYGYTFLATGFYLEGQSCFPWSFSEKITQNR